MIPKDPHILLSFVNTRLRDQYNSLDSLCEDLNLNRSDLEDKLKHINYVYDIQENQFK